MQKATKGRASKTGTKTGSREKLYIITTLERGNNEDI